MDFRMSFENCSVSDEELHALMGLWTSEDTAQMLQGRSELQNNTTEAAGSAAAVPRAVLARGGIATLVAAPVTCTTALPVSDAHPVPEASAPYRRTKEHVECSRVRLNVNAPPEGMNSIQGPKVSNSGFSSTTTMSGQYSHGLGVSFNQTVPGQTGQGSVITSKEFPKGGLGWGCYGEQASYRAVSTGNTPNSHYMSGPLNNCAPVEAAKGVSTLPSGASYAAVLGGDSLVLPGALGNPGNVSVQGVPCPAGNAPRALIQVIDLTEYNSGPSKSPPPVQSQVVAPEDCPTPPSSPAGCVTLELTPLGKVNVPLGARWTELDAAQRTAVTRGLLGEAMMHGGQTAMGALGAELKKEIMEKRTVLGIPVQVPEKGETKEERAENRTAILKRFGGQVTTKCIKAVWPAADKLKKNWSAKCREMNKQHPGAIIKSGCETAYQENHAHLQAKLKRKERSSSDPKPSANHEGETKSNSKEGESRFPKAPGRGAIPSVLEPVTQSRPEEGGRVIKRQRQKS